jgi:Ca-activated chloride channel family protein
VRIFPVGIGSPNGAVVEVDGFSVATALDADLLRGVARTSGGTYFAAGDAAALQRIYDSIDLKLTTVGRDTEITAIFAGAALVLILVAAGLSMRWSGRVI